jgi:hypothetical protein
MKDQEEIGRALYLLRAGADPEVFLKTLRAYVIQNTATHEQADELLRALMEANPLVVTDVLQSLPKPKRKKSRKTANATTNKTKSARRPSA